MGGNRTDPKGLLTGVKWDFIKGYKITRRLLLSYAPSLSLSSSSVARDRIKEALNARVRDVCSDLKSETCVYSFVCLTNGCYVVTVLQAQRWHWGYRHCPSPEKSPGQTRGPSAHRARQITWGAGGGSQPAARAPICTGQPVLSPTPRKSGQGRPAWSFTQKAGNLDVTLLILKCWPLIQKIILSCELKH